MSIIENEIGVISPELYIEPEPFSNPICQSTYKALPKIYGQPSTTKMKYTSKKFFNNFGRLKYTTSDNQQAISENKIQNKQSSSQKQTYKSKGLFKYQPTNKTHVINNDSSPELEKTTRFSKGKIKKIKLPELSALKSFLPNEIQTSHKIIRTDSNQKVTSMAFLTTGLGQLVSNNAKTHTTNIQKRIKSLEQIQMNNQSQDGNIIKKGNINIKNKNFDTESDQKLTLLAKKSDKIFNRYQQESDQDNGISNRKNRQSSFKNPSYRQSTVFQQNNKKMQYFTKRKRNNSTYSNGLFVIPQQNQYQSYIENYQPMDKDFNFKQLLKHSNFQIMRNSKGIYFGEVLDESKHGQGLYISQRQIYQGKFQNNLKVQGCQRNVDGVYIGQFLNGQRSGIGVFRWNNGEIFEGQWKKGVKNGHGVWTSPKGDYYDGQWFMNRQQGKGTFKHKSSTYKGSFLNFLKHGHGQQKFANGDHYVGQYKQGRPDGMGKYEWSTGGYYQGSFSKGFRQGFGKWVQNNGNIYQGNFRQDCKHGQGKQIFKTGETFIGQFDQGNQISGILYAKNGSILKKIQ